MQTSSAQHRLAQLSAAVVTDLSLHDVVACIGAASAVHRAVSLCLVSDGRLEPTGMPLFTCFCDKLWSDLSNHDGMESKFIQDLAVKSSNVEHGQHQFLAYVVVVLWSMHSYPCSMLLILSIFCT